MEATDQIDKLISSRARDREQANAEAALRKAEDRRKREEMQRENRALWCDHLRRLSANYVAMARDARRRARALERGETA